MTQGLEHCRRSCRRLRVPPMYTSVTARRGTPGAGGPGGSGSAEADLHGHVYDISEHGLRIELDQPLLPGERVALLLDLPGSAEPVNASACVIWVNDAQDDPGPRRMALRFTSFSRGDDRRRLIDFLGQGALVPAE